MKTWLIVLIIVVVVLVATRNPLNIVAAVTALSRNTSGPSGTISGDVVLRTHAAVCAPAFS